MMKDHPALRLDSLNEQKDSPAPAVVHRYPDKALLLRMILPKHIF